MFDIEITEEARGVINDFLRDQTNRAVRYAPTRKGMLDQLIEALAEAMVPAVPEGLEVWRHNQASCLAGFPVISRQVATVNEWWELVQSQRDWSLTIDQLEEWARQACGNLVVSVVDDDEALILAAYLAREKAREGASC